MIARVANPTLQAL